MSLLSYAGEGFPPVSGGEKLTAADWLYIHNYPLLEGLEGAEMDAALAFLDAEYTVFARDAVLLRDGGRTDRFHLLLSGCLQTEMKLPSGEKAVTGRLLPGDSYGETEAMADSEDGSLVSLTAAEPSGVISFSAEGFSALPYGALEIGMPLFRRMTAMIARKAAEARLRNEVLSKPLLREKLNTFFAQCVRRYGSRTFRIGMDRSEMADYLGTNRSALSRELSAMRDEGLLDYYKNSFRIRR